MKTRRIFLIPADGPCGSARISIGLGALETLVGGTFEHIPAGPVSLVVNAHDRGPVNNRATDLWRALVPDFSDSLRGPVVVIGPVVDDEPFDLTDTQLDVLRRIFIAEEIDPLHPDSRVAQALEEAAVQRLITTGEIRDLGDVVSGLEIDRPAWDREDSVVPLRPRRRVTGTVLRVFPFAPAVVGVRTGVGRDALVLIGGGR